MTKPEPQDSPPSDSPREAKRHMFLKQFYLGCLAHASYLVGSDGEAAVIDPQRDVDQYIDLAGSEGLTIRYVIETHLHADFVSGHRELAERTGAQIVFGWRAGATFPHLAVRDGSEFRIGSIVLRFLETPGHTPEGISILATDSADPSAPRKLFTGDTLFIGDVGRPDLVGSKGFSAEEMAGMLYDSLHEKILSLPDEVEVYPAHGAGSLCGRNMSKETMSTIGEQRQFNYALRPMSRETFIEMMTTDLPEAPAYFARDAEINRTGAAALEKVRQALPLAPDEVIRLQKEGALVLDVRSASAFGNGHVPGSLNIGLGGQFASWAGSLIPAGIPVVIVGEGAGSIAEATTRLARVGIESVAGYLEDGIYAWDRASLPLDETPQMPVDELQARIGEHARLLIVDVRRPAEYTARHIQGSVNIPLSDLEKRAAQFDAVGAPKPLDPGEPVAVICGSGYRSSAGASLLNRLGFRELYNVVGGMAAWTSAGYPVEVRA